MTYNNKNKINVHVGHVHKAKKSLGQNFLKSEAALRKIVETGEIKPDDIILEIGPGKGALTKKLLEKAKCVIAVEKDRELFELLKNKFENEIKNGKLILIEEDILDFSVKDKIFSDSPQKFSAENFRESSPSLLPRVHSRTFYPKLDYKIIANIPYNITGAILKKFLEEEMQPTMMVLMVQYEVAKRIYARVHVGHGHKESILSISVKAYGIPKIEMKVPARYFSPAPKVDSAIISIKNISRDFFIENKINESDFWQIIHAGFAHKRKKLSSNLKVLKNINGVKGEGNASALHLEEEPPNFASALLGNKRAEELSLKDWTQLISLIRT